MALQRMNEVERKYTVLQDAVLPDLGRLRGTAVRLDPEAELEAVYFDTVDRTLLAARIALRRRTGGHDAGWHVKLPGAVGRVELHAPIDSDAPDRLPDDLERVLRSRLRRRPVEPIARIHTLRRTAVVSDGQGERVEIADDVVTATDVAAGVVRRWREWEAEQIGDDAAAAAKALERVDAALRSAGATPSASPAKLAQALGLIGSDRAPTGRTAGAALRRMLAPHADRLHAGTQDLAIDPADEDGEIVHDLRKSLRRLRGLLALSAVAGPAGADLRLRLERLGAGLGEARDPLVAAEVAERLLADRPHGAEVALRWAVTRQRRNAAAGTSAELAGLGSDEGLAAFEALDRFVAGPGPDGPQAGAPAKRFVRLARRTVQRAATRSAAALDREASLDDLHAARKAARRTRFVVEAVLDEGLAGRSSRLARAGLDATDVQDALGAERDVALVAETAPHLAAQAAAAGEDSYAIGVLGERAAREAERLAKRARRRMRSLIRAARRAG